MRVENNMSNMATTLGAAEMSTTAVRTERKSGLFSRMLASMVAAREAQARRHVQNVLVQMSDLQLTDIGFTAEQIKAVRAEGRIPTSYWA